MKKIVLSLTLACSLIISTTGFSSPTALANNDLIKPTTSIKFITEDKNERDIVNNIERNANDDAFLQKNHLEKGLLRHISKKSVENITSMNLQASFVDSKSESADTICLNYNLFKEKSTVDYVKKQVDNGKTIYFYGNNIDLVDFCNIYGLEKNIPNEVEEKNQK